ncbi:hypothetical protein [Sinomicrobium sp.]
MNLKTILTQLGKYVLLGMFLLGCLFLFVGGERNIYFIGIGILLMIPGVIYYYWDRLKTKKSKKSDLEKFKEKADKIKVNLTDLDIVSNSWTETTEVYNSGYTKYGEYVEKAKDNTKEVAREVNYIRIQVPYKGQTVNYDLNIPMDATTLKMHFVIQKETILYIDPKNPDKKYLDLEFLN